MSQESPNISSLPTPAEKPALPDGLIQLAITPEKACTKNSRAAKVPRVSKEKRTVCFSEEINAPETEQEKRRCAYQQHEYQE